MQTVAITPNAVPQEVPLALVMESTTNPRQHFEEDDLNGLAETIRKSGVYQAILARPREDRLEIVFGARRYRASQLAGRETIPALVREMSDAEVLEAQLVENLQRRDVHPMEEAEGYKRLLALTEPTYTVEQIAAKVGKTPAYIATRLKLTDLCDEVAAEFYQNHIGVGHALLLAKLPADMQRLGITACFKEVYAGGGDKPARIILPVRALRFWIETNVLLLLKDAPFDKRNAELVTSAGSCVDCPKRTGHNKLLFADLGKQDACTDPGCYQVKVQAHIAAAVASKPQLVQISTSYRAQAEGSTVLSRNKYVAIREEKPKDKEQAKQAEFKSCKDTIQPSSRTAKVRAPCKRFARTLSAVCITRRTNSGYRTRPAVRSGRPSRRSSAARKPSPTPPASVCCPPLPPLCRSACSSATCFSSRSGCCP